MSCDTQLADCKIANYASSLKKSLDMLSLKHSKHGNCRSCNNEKRQTLWQCWMDWV